MDKEDIYILDRGNLEMQLFYLSIIYVLASIFIYIMVLCLHKVYSYTIKESSIPNIEEIDSTTRELYDNRHEINDSTTPKSTISKTDNIKIELITLVFDDINCR